MKAPMLDPQCVPQLPFKTAEVQREQWLRGVQGSPFSFAGSCPGNQEPRATFLCLGVYYDYSPKPYSNH